VGSSDKAKSALHDLIKATSTPGANYQALRSNAKKVKRVANTASMEFNNAERK
jgi:hypothetical protein